MLKTSMDSLEVAKKRSLKALGNRSYSEQEMIKKLTSKGVSDDDSEETVKWLVELGYINDAEYASQIVKHYTTKGFGEARIRAELFKRGIPRDMWDEKLAELDEIETDDFALTFLQSKLRGSDDKEDLRRASDALVRRGFSYDDARAAVSRYLECPEE